MQDDDIIIISCLWCSDPLFIENHFVEFITLYDNSAHPSWFGDALHDLCSCFDCVQEYHKAIERGVGSDLCPHRKLCELAYKNDVSRLESYLRDQLEKIRTQRSQSAMLGESDDEDHMSSLWPQLLTLQKDLKCPLQEILKYPRLLLQPSMAEVFVEALLELEEIEQPLEVTCKYPGVYLLLVHPHVQVGMGYGVWGVTVGMG